MRKNPFSPPPIPFYSFLLSLFRYARGNCIQGGRVQMTISSTLLGSHTNFESLIVECLSLPEKYPQFLKSSLMNGSVASVSVRPDMMFEHPSENSEHSLLLQPKYPIYDLPYRSAYPDPIDIAQPISALLSCQDFIDLYELWQVEVCGLLRSLAMRWAFLKNNPEVTSDLGPSARRFIISHKYYMRDATPANSGSCQTCGRT